MIITEIGEVGVDLNGQKHLLRPSLYAMTQIGEPEEIVRVYASVMHEAAHADQLSDARKTIYSCCEDDLTHAFGCLLIDESSDAIQHIPGAATQDDTLLIARHLLKHGVVGDFEPSQTKEGDSKSYTNKFEARKHAAIAVAHLGIGTKEAWAMTMTELVGALRAKFPPEKGPGADAPSAEELDETLAWHDRVLAARNKQ